jgi:hypothetical protein
MGDGDLARDEARRGALALSIAGCTAAACALVLCYATGLPWRVWLGVCGVHAACFATGWFKRELPRRDALVIISIQVLITLVAVSMTAEAQAASGRPFVPFNGNKLIAFLLAIFCPSLTVGAFLLATCVIAAFVQASHWGPEVRALIPQLEPLQTFVVVSTALLFLYIRRRHAVRVEELARVQAEAEGFERVTAIGLEVRERVELLVGDLHRALTALRRDIATDAIVKRLARVTDRLQRLSGTLKPLRRVAGLPDPELGGAIEARRAAVAVSAIAAFAGALVVVLELVRGYSLYPGLIMLVPASAAFAHALALPRLPTAAYHAMFAIAGLGAMVAVLLNNGMMATRGQFDAFPGIKLAMLVFAFLAPSGRLGALLIAFGTLAPVLETYAFWSPEQRAHMPMFEPWSTVLFGVTAFVLLVAQRRRTSLLRTLVQARADRDALARTARMVLALRDLVNSPLQTLMMSIDLAYDRVDASQLDAITAAVARLREQLQTLPVFEIDDALVFDAFDNLEREVMRVTEEARVMTVARY